jgi:UDP:flavonoid glycosyltransferase YjiC (YdhE family)
MANIVFLMVPEKGHLNPSFKIAKSLVSRGHHVYYLLLPEFERYLDSQDLQFLPFFEKRFPTAGEFRRDLSTLENLASRLEIEAAASGVTMFMLLNEELKEKLKKIDAHLLVLDIYTFIDPREYEIRVPIIFLNPTIASPWSTNDSAAIVALSEIPILILCPEEFDLPHPAPAPPTYYVEASVDFQRKEIDFPWSQIREDKQLIYCSLGTQSHWSFSYTSHELNQGIRKNFLQSVIDAATDRPDWQLILYLGNHLHPQDFHAVPSNVLLANSAPQIEILKRASLMITHGGLNTIKECIFLGVPMIVFPLVGDQFRNADCVAYHKLGLRGNIEESSDKLILSLADEVISNPIFRSNIDAMRNVFENAENAGRAVSIIESILASGQKKEP